MITLTVTLHDSTTDLCLHDSLASDSEPTTAHIALGSVNLTADQLCMDPPSPSELSNAIGLLMDELDDLQRFSGPLATTPDTVTFHGDAAAAFASVELGAPIAAPLLLSREAAEDVFRTVATESLRDRCYNPGLPESRAATIVATGCIVVAIMRRLGLRSVWVDPQ